MKGAHTRPNNKHNNAYLSLVSLGTLKRPREREILYRKIKTEAIGCGVNAPRHRVYGICLYRFRLNLFRSPTLLDATTGSF